MIEYYFLPKKYGGMKAGDGIYFVRADQEATYLFKKFSFETRRWNLFRGGEF
jgi:hypothetical protein